MVSGLPLAQSALAVVAGSGVEKQKQGGQRMNNIRMANIVILKRLAVKENRKLALTKFSKPKALHPTLQITTPVVGIEEKPLVPQMSRNIERSNDQIWMFPLSLSLPEYNDLKGSPIVADGDEMSDILPPSEEKQVHFYKEDDRVYDIPEPNNYQKEILSSLKLQQPDKVQDDIFDIKVGAFLDDPFTLPI